MKRYHLIFFIFFAAAKLNEDLKIIQKWSLDWPLTFNLPKTESMVIGLKHNKEERSRLFLHNTPIVDLNKYKHIGIWLENNLQ